MSASVDTPRAPAPRRVRGEGALVFGLAAFAVYHFGLAVFMAAAPHAFYTAIGPFDAFNSHYIRDTATFNAALGAGFAISIWRPAWRVPVVAVTTIQFALHSLNHLIDINDAHPSWTGYFDFFSLLAATLLLAGLLTLARASSTTPHTKGDTT
jgi:hypothetical protein